MTLQQWEESLANSMVDFHLTVITIVSLPEVLSIVRYYQVNTYKGCSDPNSPNFDYIANFGIPIACLPPETNTTFWRSISDSELHPKWSVCTNKVVKSIDSCPTGYQLLREAQGVLYQIQFANKRFAQALDIILFFLQKTSMYSSPYHC